MTKYKAFAATVAGISHTKSGKECQDCSFGNDNDRLYSAAAVADGHGDENCFRSAKGARCAVDSAVQVIHAFIHSEWEERKKFTLPFDEQGFERWLRKTVVEGIIGSWYTKVNAYLTAYPFTQEELAGVSEKYRKRYEAAKDLHHAYGTTLIACAVTADYWFGLHIGDGRFTVLNCDGSFSQPVPWDDRCFLNATTSICDDDAIPSARLYCRAVTVGNPPPAAIFLCSDGVDDNYPVEANETHLYKLFGTIARTFASDGFVSTRNQLKDLCRSFATKGKGDDTSIAGLVNMDAVQAAVKILDEKETRA